MILRIVITPGEPAGIGPDITIKIAQQAWPVELIVVGDPELLTSRAKQLGLPLKCDLFDADKAPIAYQPGKALKIVPVSLATSCQAGQLNTHNANYVIRCLEVATDLCLQHKAHALVTGPVHKGIINDAHIKFTGHTEFLANYCQVTQPIMLFVTPEAKVALVTTHLPLSEVPKAITAEKIQSVIRILHHEFQKRFGLTRPRMLICGLNPHAGEQGHLGCEERDIIEPTLNALRDENFDLIGPLPADTVFTQKQLALADVVLAMYHDQALPVVKYMGFGHAVNVTLGLPIIRTSVDHGTALDIAGASQADEGSLVAALQLAIELAVTLQEQNVII